MLVASAAAFVVPVRVPTTTSTWTPTWTPTWTTTCALHMALTASEQAHAREVFASFQQRIEKIKTGDEPEEQECLDDDEDDDACYLEPECLVDMLQALDIPASDEDAAALFRYLDVNDEGRIHFDADFLPWYEQAADSAKEQAAAFQQLLQSRRTVNEFLSTPIDTDVVRRAVACAICAPNRHQSEPWRFIHLGKETVAAAAKLQAKLHEHDDRPQAETLAQRWTSIPGWLVVTYPKSAAGNTWQQREDFKSVACAMENFMLSLWSEGIGSKLLNDGEVPRTDEFAALCGINVATEKLAGVIWYGFAAGGLAQGPDPRVRHKSVDDVLEFLS